MSTAKLLGLEVVKAGVLALLQDAGRFGYEHLGLSTGGPIDSNAFALANNLCGNSSGCTSIEIAVGGLALRAQLHTTVAVTGAVMPVHINGKPKAQWCSHLLVPGDLLELGYARRGCRGYVAVAGGVQVRPQFGSTATVLREHIGGLNGGALVSGDLLPCEASAPQLSRQLPIYAQPQYPKALTLRLVLGYQHLGFDDDQLQRFFTSEYRVSALCDRMAYRLEGPAVVASLRGMVSEGNCLGAVQLPPDGQPMVLLNDRQSIGGYPKMGSVLAADCARLGQLSSGDSVRFSIISQFDAVAIAMAQLSQAASEAITEHGYTP